MGDNASYWWGESRESLLSAEILLDKDRYLESAFFCHLAVEKALKALIAAKTEGPPPKSHNLLLLAQSALADEQLSQDFRAFLADIMPFQLESRYPSDRRRLLEENPPDRFRELLDTTKEALAWLEQRLK